MSIYYRLDKQTDNLSPENAKKTGLYPRVITRGSVTLKELSHSAAEGTTFNAVELETALRLAFGKLADRLENGYNVSIEDFGTFSVTAEATRPVQKPTDIRAESIRTKRIVFKAAPRLMRKAKHWRYERLPAKN